MRPDRIVRPQTVLLIVASAMFMEQLDGTVLATALPTMARSFDADPLRMNVALTSYLLTLAMFIPASGRIADRFGGAGHDLHPGDDADGMDVVPRQLPLGLREAAEVVDEDVRVEERLHHSLRMSRW